MTTRRTSIASHNRLAAEISPYLLQHAGNPVDWYPWCDEAFERALTEDKPVFLSIGYATCYWCHVMERESFEDEAIAELMNEHQINIKVDREERPDVDELYMSAVQIMNHGQGGWPMSVWIDPQTRKPFFAGTYFPPHEKFGRPSLPQVVKQIASIWRERQHDVESQANSIAERIAAFLAAPARIEPLGREHVHDAISTLMSVYDRQHGGFGRAPKFPQPVYLELLLATASDDEPRLQAVRHTLDRMAIGGMYDQVGGGFHRYSVDEAWIVPHFEKMLYDNGQLAAIYARAAERFDDDFYREITRETLEYVLREMTDERGGFFSAQDAEVNAHEGANYLWTADEARAALREADLDDVIDFALHAYGLDAGTNFRDPHDAAAEPRNVLHLISRPEPLSRSLGIDLAEFRNRIERINAALLAARQQRDQPATDDKVLAGWNGLMITGFAEGGRVLHEPRYLEAAERAARFMLETMRDDAGDLYRSCRAGEVRVPAFLEDYALFARGLLTLYRASGNDAWLNAARELADRARELFRDHEHGGYFTTRADQTDLFLRVHATHDGAVPSGTSVMLNNLLDLHEATGEQHYLDEAAATLRSLSHRISHSPTGLSLATLALHRMLERVPHHVPSQTDHHPAETGDDAPVSAALNTNEISLPHTSHVTIELRLCIKPGWHIAAHEPGGEQQLTPLSVMIDGDGVTMQPSYPEGAPLRSEVSQSEPINVYSDELNMPLRLHRTGEVRGEHRVIVTCQPCTDELCREPMRFVLPLRIEAD